MLCVKLLWYPSVMRWMLQQGCCRSASAAVDCEACGRPRGGRNGTSSSFFSGSTVEPKKGADYVIVGAIKLSIP